MQANDASTVPIVEKLKLLKNRGPGTMERYLELRELEKQAEVELEQSQPHDDNLSFQQEDGNILYFRNNLSASCLQSYVTHANRIL